MKNLVITFVSIFLAGCSSLFSDSYGYQYGCIIQDGHFTESINYIEPSLACPITTSNSFTSSSHCRWVKSYVRLDGKHVDGHYRCNLEKIKQGQSLSSFWSPLNSNASGTNCHSVSGYYRKDGTYVRGHTRCR